MRNHVLRAAPALAALSLALAAPVHAQQYVPSDMDVNELRQMQNTTWRSNTGYQGVLTQPTPDSFRFVGLSLADRNASQEIGATLDASLHTTGTWVDRLASHSTDNGSASITYNSRLMHGTLTSTSGATKDYFACKVTGKAGASRFSGGWLWSNAVSVTRDESGQGVMAIVEFQNVSDWPQTLDFSSFVGTIRSSDGKIAHSSKPRTTAGESMPGKRMIEGCDTQTYVIPFGSVQFASMMFEVEMSGKPVASWLSWLPAPEPVDPAPPSEPDPEEPVPTPEPPPSPTPTPTPVPAPGPVGSGVPAGAGSWQLYGSIWSFKIDELGQGPDGNWQGIVSVRSESTDRVGMTASQIEAFLINEDGETIRQIGNLYRPSVTGPAASLERLTGTQWMQKGDTIRVRLLWEGSKGLRPVTLRVRNSGGDMVSHDFPMR